MPGYVLGPPLGFGMHGAVWSAAASGAGGKVSPDRDCAVAILDLGDRGRGDAQRRRLATLVGTRHEHVAEVLDVVDLGERCAVVSERVDGPTLAVLRVARPPLALPEVVSLLGPLTDALVHLHRHGVTHGDVSPANVVLAASDRPVLVDLAGEVAFEAGTPGFRAPERLTGSPASPSADVWSLATLGLWLLDAETRAQAEVMLAPALHDDPRERCGAAALALLVERLGEPQSLTVPSAAALAHGSLRARAALAETRLAQTRRQRNGRPRGGDDRRDDPITRRRRHRARPRGPARLLALVAGVVAVALAVTLHPVAPVDDGRAAPAPGGRPPAVPGHRESSTASPVPPPTASAHEWSPAEATDAVADLVRLRDAAINDGDLDALAALSVPGSPAAHADEVLASALSTGTDVKALATHLRAARLVASNGREARVAVITTQGAHRREALAGGHVDVPEQPERCSVLRLRAGVTGAQVRDVEPCGPGDVPD